MRELKPYQTLQGLKKAIDNGGRFYNLLAEADDEVVSRGELAKAAGAFTAGVSAFLFLEMAQQNISVDDQQSILKLLDTKLRKKFLRDRPVKLLPSELDKAGVVGKSFIVGGYPRFVEDRTEMKGTIMVPIMVGKVFVPVSVPVINSFDIYEMFDDKKMKKPSSVIATPRGQRLLHDGPIRFGGVLRKLDYDKKSEPIHPFFLAALYYTKL